MPDTNEPDAKQRDIARARLGSALAGLDALLAGALETQQRAFLARVRADLVAAQSLLFGLAAAPPVGATAIVPPTATTETTGTVRKRLLLVEDSPTNRAVALAMLKTAPVDVDAVENGALAIERLAEQHYDLVLMDVAMPVLDGLEATRAIRAGGGAVAAIPIIAMTANALATDEARCRDAGMDDYLTKPIERARLLATLRRWTGLDTTGDGRIDEPTLLRLGQEVERATLTQLLIVFVGEAAQRATRIEAASATDGDDVLSTIEREAHAMRGSAQTFGATQLATRSGQIEDAARAASIESLRQAARGLAALVADAERAYREAGYL